MKLFSQNDWMVEKIDWFSFYELSFFWFRGQCKWLLFIMRLLQWVFEMNDQISFCSDLYCVDPSDSNGCVSAGFPPADGKTKYDYTVIENGCFW